MRIKILTLNGYFNYGNRLQLFALGQTLEQFGEVDVYWPKNMRTQIIEFIKYHVLPFKFKKEAKLNRFTKKNIPRISCNSSADYYIIGSDQVWNPDYYKNRPYLLMPLKNENRISYAASLGVEQLNESQKEQFRHALEGYKAISLREESARKLLQPLTTKKIVTVLDPTLLLDKTEYIRMEKSPKDIKEGEKYILCYILGNREHLKAINDYARKEGCRIVLFSDKEGSSYGVEEFLYLIHHAELICTDSFHACVFSFIFDRPFVAFRRSGKADYMYSRLQNFIETFHLQGREFNGKTITKKNVLADYVEGKKILKKERVKSLDYLKSVLEIEDER